MQSLYDWQKDCLNLWFQNNCLGIAHVVTGAGKTILALGALARLDADRERLGGRRLRVKIVVPKIFLTHQWASVLKRELSVPQGEIGYYYGGRKGECHKKYMLYVVNSARYALARHVLDDVDRGDCVLLIADECHHYGSTENARMFDFFPYLPKGERRYFALGLSATPAVPVGAMLLDSFLGKEIYEYGFAEALQANIICDFSIFRVGVDFSPGEWAEYDALTDRLSRGISQLKQLCPALRRLAGDSFFAKLQVLTADKNPQLSQAAQSVLAYMRRRRELVYLAEARPPCALALIARLPPEARIIIFGERIESADTLFQRLRHQYPGQVGRYHSGMSAPAKKAALAQYQSGEIRILVSCKALDEGLNIPQTDVGIILSGTTTARQSIQRLGRILRRTDAACSAYLYAIYVNQAQESEEDLLGFAPSNVHAFTYDSACDEFFCPEYQALCQRAWDSLLQKKAAPALLAETEKNMRLGAIRGDYFLSEQACAGKISTATSIQEKNYWITMALLVQKRSNKDKMEFTGKSALDLLLWGKQKTKEVNHMTEIQNGRLTIDGCDAVGLAEKYGTPLYVYSKSELDRHFDELRETFLSCWPNTRVAYAAKAFCTVGMCRMVDRAGFCIDVVSGGELATALAAQFPPERIEMNGNNKLRQELELAITAGVGRVIVDGFDELDLVEELCAAYHKRVNVLYRVTPGIPADSHDYIVTGKKDSKFGFPLDEDVIYPAVEKAIAAPHINFLGFHFHIGSQLFDRAPYEKAVEAVLNLVRGVRTRFHYDVTELNLGGGFGITYTDEERKPYSYYLSPLMERIETFCREEGIARPAVVIEPGRSIVGDAAVTLYTVGTVKDITGVRKYVSVDGGMTDNIRPALYQAVYRGLLANRADEPPSETVTICGKCCESGDILIRDGKFPPARRGDILALFSTGAYGYSMASNYNSNPVPAVVLAHRGRDELMVRRQSFEHLIANQLIPASLK